jgi:hypothetical protein
VFPKKSSSLVKIICKQNLKEMVMESIKAKLTAEPVNRPTRDEWVREFNVGAYGKPLEEVLGRSSNTDRVISMMQDYNFNKLKIKNHG